MSVKEFEDLFVNLSPYLKSLTDIMYCLKQSGPALQDRVGVTTTNISTVTHCLESFSPYFCIGLSQQPSGSTALMSLLRNEEVKAR